MIILFGAFKELDDKAELSLFFTSWDDSAEAAKLIGKFVGKPAFDSVGRQVFTPAS